jgi:Ca2+-binding RTX toxin-like protein
VRVTVFDTIVSNATGPGIQLFSIHPGTLVYRAGFNAVFASGASYLGGRPAGSANLKVDPDYLDRASGDFRLRASSPLIDRGVVCSPGGVANQEAADHARLSGPTVDVGAYEHGAGKASGQAFVGSDGADTLVGTAGADILCGMGGGDVLFGDGGDRGDGGDGGDYVDGGEGPDLLFGDGGADRLFGRDGDDDLCTNDGVGGNDRADGGKGSDGSKFDAGDLRVSIEHGAICDPA